MIPHYLFRYDIQIMHSVHMTSEEISAGTRPNAKQTCYDKFRQKSATDNVGNTPLV